MLLSKRLRATGYRQQLRAKRASTFNLQPNDGALRAVTSAI
jgi:hypothetical protein